MLLLGKRTLVFGAGGFVGRAVARAFAQEGAQVLLSGRRLATVEPVAAALRAAGGRAEAAEVDAGDEAATERYVARMAEAGGVDVVFNAIGLPAGEVAGFVKPSLEATAADLMEYANVVVRSQFITARAAARWMLPRRSGVIVFLTATPARGVAPLMVGHSAGHAAIEGLVRCLAAEWSPQGVRVVGLRSGGMPESPRIQQVLGRMAGVLGVPPEAMGRAAAERPALRRMPTSEETGRAVAFLASDHASALTGAILNASCGELFD